jgi:hypothetical protein
MKKIFNALFLFIFCLMIAGCAATIPIGAYIPQNHVRTAGAAAIGDFTYQPFLDKRVLAANQLQTTAAGTLYIGLEVSELVKRGTALELEKSGINLDENAKYEVSGNVLEFKLDDLGYSVDWLYSIRYRIQNRTNNQVVFEDTFTPPMKTTGKFGLPSDYEASVNNMVQQGYEMFIRTPEVRELLK